MKQISTNDKEFRSTQNRDAFPFLILNNNIPLRQTIVGCEYIVSLIDEIKYLLH